MVKGATEAAYTLTRDDLRGTRLRRPLRLAVTATNAAGDVTALSPPVGTRNPPPRPRLAFAAAAYAEDTLALAVTCRPGAAPCAGTVVAAGARKAVDVPGGGQALVLLRPRTPPGKTVRARFRPAAAGAGAAVVTRLAVVRPRAARGRRPRR
jgi:hypothetical protein